MPPAKRPGPVPAASPKPAPQAGSALLEGGGAANTQPPIPYYTVPRNATLIGSTAMTALVGRIPVKGKVQDPWPFKVITGADNLAANGLSIPHVNGMIWSGTAIGDWTLGCVSGRLNSVTFLFDDGTIRTVSQERRTRGAGNELAPQDDQHLGWISDRFGNPCVNGKRVTNAGSWLAQRTLLAALEAGGEAAAAGETTSTVSPLFGTSTSTVTGNVGTYIAGKGVAGGADDAAQWLNDRMGQSFDAVFAVAGTKVAVHVDQEIPIDYHPDGRKLNHAQGMHGGHAARLD
jgi:integrating conjugative element protein (TIGR03752 family)